VKEVERQFKSLNRPIPFRFQGQFAEESLETGYNQFLARLYDLRISRSMIPDPGRQFHGEEVKILIEKYLRITPKTKYQQIMELFEQHSSKQYDLELRPENENNYF
jgi:hypothetical protein